MSRIPPNLLYLTIYNPTLKPVGPVAKDDEDAEEQAHIVFYTSKERATSRDRMLRQVGLAKALVNFSAAFDAHAPCESVHSQTKRMLMLSPEPDFWIHVAIELARVPRTARGKEKSKGKNGDTDKAAAPAFDHDEASVHDGAVRAALLGVYERFKLTHGSFASILANLGQEALELQLERFFTVWAWSWDFGEGIEFADTLAPPLHPLHQSLLPILDEFLQDLQTPASTLLISPPYIVPSSLYTRMYPASLSRHLLTLAPAARPSATPSTLSENTVRGGSTGTIHEKASEGGEAQKRERAHATSGEHGFMGLPQFSMPKLNWAGYLTFGKKAGKGRADGDGARAERESDEARRVQAESEGPEDEGAPTQTHDDAQERQRYIEAEPAHGDTALGTKDIEREHGLAQAKVDLTALDDAMSSISVPAPSSELGAPSVAGSNVTSPPATTLDVGGYVEGEIARPTSRAEGELLSAVEGRGEAQGSSLEHGDMVDAGRTPVPDTGSFPLLGPVDATSPDIHETPSPGGADDSSPVSQGSSAGPEDPPSLLDAENAPPQTPPQHTVTTVHLEDADGKTRRRKIALYMRSSLMIAFIVDAGQDEVAQTRDESPSSGVTESMPALFDALENATTREEIGGSLESLPSTARILQPKDQHIISTDNFLIASSGFSSRSEHLYNVAQLLDSDPEIREVFSRGQNPQYWHVGRRGLGNDRKEDVAGDIFMEVFRKEASLADVDNAVAASIRRSGLE